ncbi:MAG: peptidoglycan DD-metalloendopeptidase family protein [Gemmatimonadota bacterium]|jgi:septal ring factor EnvC (AmiA/AmiB activator)
MRHHRGAAAALAFVVFAVCASPVAAQSDTQKQLRDSRARLDQIRREREQLQQQMQTLQTRVHDVASELANIEQQVLASTDALKELDFQTVALASSVDTITAQLVHTRDRLKARSVLLRHRLRSIYEQGPLHTVRVLLSARSFGDLLSRYKYLHLVAVHDRLLLDEVSSLEKSLTSQENELKSSLAQLQRLRAEKLSEFAQLQYLERRQQRTLQDYRARARRTRGRLQQLAEDEAHLTDVIANLERARREEERRRAIAGAAPAGAGNLNPNRDMGSLNWPVAGKLVYRFGPDRRPNGVTLRWNGIGIGAAPGTPVHAVKAGTVVLAQPMEGYGPSVIISHGGGYYTLYMYLKKIQVVEGQDVNAGQVVGTVGGENTPEGPHVEFRIHAPVGGGAPVPVDPLQWLKPKPGG